MDVKIVPKKCYTGELQDKFYQYTVIDEASRERFIFPYKEQSSYSTIDFIKRSITYFGYKPKIIQTDNGQEFTYKIINVQIFNIHNFLLKIKRMVHKESYRRYHPLINLINVTYFHVSY